MTLSLDPIPTQLRLAIDVCRLIQIRGRVTQVPGTLLKAVVPGVRIGEHCHLRNPDNTLSLQAAVIGFA
ncbi:EscN/YscN/HrcN family type III secretion system ATPase, partial [Aeromonas veronii]